MKRASALAIENENVIKVDNDSVSIPSAELEILRGQLKAQSTLINDLRLQQLSAPTNTVVSLPKTNSEDIYQQRLLQLERENASVNQRCNYLSTETEKLHSDLIQKCSQIRELELTSQQFQGEAVSRNWCNISAC